MSIKEDTPARLARRRYELKNKEIRKASSANFQVLMPRSLYTEINEFLSDNGITKVDFVKYAYEMLKADLSQPDAVNG
ncbi:MAG: hypothetical protein J1F33_01010 [Clostridiales bacterium]|nr:hypothetical protein [Clostridiales bacterium]